MKRSLALFAVAVSFASTSAFAAAPISGWISDANCAAKHAGTGGDCAKKCIGGGAAPVFVDEAKKAVWTIDNPDAVKDFYGEHVAVKGKTDAAKKSIHVDSVVAAK